MRVLLDTNVILDAMLQRPPWHVEADAILLAASQEQVVCAATPLGLATVFYVGRRVVGTAQARAAISSYLQAFDILPVDKQALEDADAMPGNDLEDNIQIKSEVNNDPKRNGIPRSGEADRRGSRPVKGPGAPIGGDGAQPRGDQAGD